MPGNGGRGHAEVSIDDLVTDGASFGEGQEFFIGPFCDFGCFHRSLLL